RPTATTPIYTPSLHDALPIWYQLPHFRDPDSTRRAVDSISAHPLRMMKTPTACKPIPEIFSHTIRRIVTALAARLLQLSGGNWADRKSTRLNSSHQIISYAVF